VSVIESNQEAHRSDELGVELEGELDLATLPQLEAALAGARATDPRRIVLDCRRLEFLDCSALGAVARHRQLVPGVALAFRAPSSLLTRMLALVGWSDLVEPE
jgi:anti-anti-sigma factor